MTAAEAKAARVKARYVLRPTLEGAGGSDLTLRDLYIGVAGAALILAREPRLGASLDRGASFAEVAAVLAKDAAAIADALLVEASK